MDEQYIRELELERNLKLCEAARANAEAAVLEAEIMLLKNGKTKEEIEARRHRPTKTFDEMFEDAFGVKLRR